MASNYFDSVDKHNIEKSKDYQSSLKTGKIPKISKWMIGLISLFLLASCGYLAYRQLIKQQQQLAKLIPVPVERTNLTVTVPAQGIVDKNKVVTHVPENNIAKIHLNQDVIIFTDKPVSGQVTHISTEPTVKENIKSFAVEIALEKEVANQLNEGENVSVDFAVVENILVVPPIAISKQNNTTGVFVGASNQPPRFVPITIGTSKGDHTEIKSGLDGTEHILIEASQLPPGQQPLPGGHPPGGRLPASPLKQPPPKTNLPPSQK